MGTTDATADTDASLSSDDSDAVAAVADVESMWQAPADVDVAGSRSSDGPATQALSDDDDDDSGGREDTPATADRASFDVFAAQPLLDVFVRRGKATAATKPTEKGASVVDNVPAAMPATVQRGGSRRASLSVSGQPAK